MESKLDEVIDCLKKLRAATQSHNQNEIIRLGLVLQTTVTGYLMEK